MLTTFRNFSWQHTMAHIAKKGTLWRGCTVTNDVPRDSKDRKWGTEARGVMANRKTFDAVYVTLAKRKLA